MKTSARRAQLRTSQTNVAAAEVPAARSLSSIDQVSRKVRDCPAPVGVQVVSPVAWLVYPAVKVASEPGP
jgi:hypothetical protein